MKDYQYYTVTALLFYIASEVAKTDIASWVFWGTAILNVVVGIYSKMKDE